MNKQNPSRGNALCLKTILAMAAISIPFPSFSETVDVKYRGPIDLALFDCTPDLDSSVVKRVCYNSQHAYMLIRLKNTWYHYCEIGQDTVDALLAAPSKGKFYNNSIRDSATGGRFGCRDKIVPEF